MSTDFLATVEPVAKCFGADIQVSNGRLVEKARNILPFMSCVHFCKIAWPEKKAFRALDFSDFTFWRLWIVLLSIGGAKICGLQESCTSGRRRQCAQHMDYKGSAVRYIKAFRNEGMRYAGNIAGELWQ